MLINILNNDIKLVFEKLNKYNGAGKNLIKIMELIIDFLKNVLVNYNCSEYFDSIDNKELYSSICSITEEAKIYKIIEILLDSIKLSKTSNNTKLIFELSIIKISQLDKKKEKTKEIEVYEEKKQIIKPLKAAEEKNISTKLMTKINKVKEIRINNALANFNKKQLLEFKTKFESIKELLLDPEYSSIVSLLLDGEIKVKGSNYIIFVYDSKGLDEYFNSILLEVELKLSKIFNEELKPIAISNDSWEIIKVEFNNSLKENKKIYNFIEETYKLEEIFNAEQSNENNLISNNEIEEIFDDIVVYN